MRASVGPDTGPVALLGGNGFIGRHVARWLAQAGRPVGVIHRGSGPVADPRVRDVRADRHDAAVLGRALRQIAPTVVVDLTAYAEADADEVLGALPAGLRRLVLVSSGDVYWTYGAFLRLEPRRHHEGPLDEAAPRRTSRHPYRPQAESAADLRFYYDKIPVEEKLRRGAPVPVTILRLPMVYGPEDPQDRVGRVLRDLAGVRGELRLNPAEAAWRCTRGYVEDVAWGIALAATDPRAEGATFNLGETSALTGQEWHQAVAGALGRRIVVLPDPAVPPSLPADWSLPLVVETRSIRERLDYHEPVGRDEGLRRSVARWRGPSGTG